MNKEDNKFNWKLVLTSFVITVIITVIISGIITQVKQPERITVYCWFNATINDAAQRDQCGIIKIISSDLTDIKIHQFEKFGKCSAKIESLPQCQGATYHLSKFRLKDLCEKDNCNVDGVACNAYFITYHNASSPGKEELEKTYFTKANLKSKEALMDEFNKCNAGGWWSWQ